MLKTNELKISGSSYYKRFVPSKNFATHWDNAYPFAVFYDINGTPLLIVPLVPKDYSTSYNEITKEIDVAFPKSKRLDDMLEIPNTNGNTGNTENTVFSDQHYYDFRDTLVLIGDMKMSSSHPPEKVSNATYYTLHQQKGAPIQWTEAPYVCFRDHLENEVYRTILFPSEYNSSTQRFDNMLSEKGKPIIPSKVVFWSCPKTGMTHVSFVDSSDRNISSKIFLTESCDTKKGTLEELRAALINTPNEMFQYDVTITRFIDSRDTSKPCTIL